MIQNVLRHLGGVERYGVASLCLFLALFVGMLVWASLQRRHYLERMSWLPLDTDPEDISNTKDSP